LFTRSLLVGAAMAAMTFGAPVAAAPACGGGFEPDCGAGQWCSYAPDNVCGILGRPGTCEARPQVCTRIYLPVCGCDGKTYSNACTANFVGMGIAYAGTCRRHNGKAMPAPRQPKPRTRPVADKSSDGLCIQVISCGIKDGQPKEYSDPCAAQRDGATNIAPKSEGICPSIK